MTFPAALLGTTVRVLRTAAGRRTLQLVLLVGGLFALGFLCGEQAHAADETPAPAKVTSAPAKVTSVPAEVTSVPAKVTSARSGGTAAGEDPARAVRTVAERLAAPVHTVAAQAVTPVQDAVTTVSRPLEAAADQGVDKPGTSTPSLPLPDLPQPRVPDVSAPLPPGPKSEAPRPQGHGGAAVPAPAELNERHARVQGRSTAVGAPASVVPYGPEATLAPQPQPQPQLVARTFAHRGTAGVGVPGRPAPTGDTDGVLGKQAADGSASRHGDAHAVTLDGRAPQRLAPGSAARVDAPRTRERHRDIPVFPG
ncbi:hypothetical protein ACWC0C_38285 [Streptomyces sp. NPDC001709]